jgi:hypothetical protein
MVPLQHHPIKEAFLVGQDHTLVLYLKLPQLHIPRTSGILLYHDLTLALQPAHMVSHLHGVQIQATFPGHLANSCQGVELKEVQDPGINAVNLKGSRSGHPQGV